MTQEELRKLTVFLAFANSVERPLAELEAELESIREIISTLDADRNSPINLQLYGKIKIDQLSKVLSLYRDTLYVFHFAGHANGEILQIEDGSANGQGLAGLLNRAEQLKLVFLNGCATWGHVQRLFEARIPAVIATSNKIGDRTASTFSRLFYEEFVARHRSLEEAFNSAKNRLILDDEVKVRDLIIHKKPLNIQPEQTGLPASWGLYLNPLYSQDQVLDWQIIKSYPFNIVITSPSTANMPALYRNPYIVGSAIKGDAPFFGRQEMLNRILGFDGQSLLLLGIRRIGKTSLLRQLEKRFTASNQKIAIYLNLQGLDSSQEMGKELLRVIRSAAKMHSLIAGFQTDTSGDLNQVLQSWIEFCEEQNLSSLLLFDEGDQLEKLSTEDLSNFKNAIDRSSLISLVITGTRSLRSLEIKEIQLVSLASATEVQKLKIFEVMELEDLLTQNNQVQVDSKVRETIKNTSGQHPYLAQYIAHKLYAEGKLRSIEDVPQATTLGNDLYLVFKDEYGRLTEAEQQLMLALHFEQATPLTSLQNNPQLNQAKLRSDLLELEEFGFVKSNKDHYFLNNIFWQQFLEPLRPKQATPPSIFISHHSTNAFLLSRLKVHLSSIKVNILDETNLPPGSIQDAEMETFINAATLIILLLSPDYLVDAQKIQERNAIKSLVAQNKRVIPILACECNWEDEFGKLVILPRDKKPLDQQANLDAILTEITKAIRPLL
jgi:hypothetical protein